MPRKLLTIFCMLLMMLFHYGRMINYWSCELIHINNNTDTTCDCEKQSKDAANDTQQSSSQKWVKERSEDLFSDKKYFSIALLFSEVKDPISINKSIGLSSGFNSSVFQPPRC